MISDSISNIFDTTVGSVNPGCWHSGPLSDDQLAKLGHQPGDPLREPGRSRQELGREGVASMSLLVALPAADCGMRN